MCLSPMIPASLRQETGLDCQLDFFCPRELGLAVPLSSASLGSRFIGPKPYATFGPLADAPFSDPCHSQGARETVVVGRKDLPGPDEGEDQSPGPGLLLLRAHRTLPQGDRITATATGPGGSTSEFSEPLDFTSN